MAKIEFYSHCAMIVKIARRKGLTLPRTYDDAAKTFFKRMGFAYGLGADESTRLDMIDHWNAMRAQSRPATFQRDVLTGTYQETK